MIFNQICFIIIQGQCDGKKKKQPTKMINKHIFLMKKFNHFPALCWGQHHVLMFAEPDPGENRALKINHRSCRNEPNIPDLMTERCIISYRCEPGPYLCHFKEDKMVPRYLKTKMFFSLTSDTAVQLATEEPLPRCLRKSKGRQDDTASIYS